jgi:hypothetical protein
MQFRRSGIPSHDWILVNKVLAMTLRAEHEFHDLRFEAFGRVIDPDLVAVIPWPSAVVPTAEKVLPTIDTNDLFTGYAIAHDSTGSIPAGIGPRPFPEVVSSSRGPNFPLASLGCGVFRVGNGTCSTSGPVSIPAS